MVHQESDHGLELVKNEMLPRIKAEKNTLAFEEAEARLKQLQETYELQRRAAAADIKILEIRRDRSETNMQQAESNAERMLIASPLPGVAVVKTTFKIALPARRLAPFFGDAGDGPAAGPGPGPALKAENATGATRKI
mgnify:CR=1 FL=1